MKDQPAGFLPRYHMSRITGHGDACFYIFHHHTAGTNGNAVANRDILHDAHRRPYIDFIADMRGMKIHTADR